MFQAADLADAVTDGQGQVALGHLGALAQIAQQVAKGGNGGNDILLDGG